MRAVKLIGTEADRGRRRSPTRRSARDTDAIVRVTHTAICGADLLPYHGYTPGFELGTTLGHEFVGVVEDAGDALGALRAGAARGQHEHDLRRHLRRTAAPAARRSATRRALFGYSGVYPRLDGGQADLVRVPRADRCLWPVPDDGLRRGRGVRRRHPADRVPRRAARRGRCAATSSSCSAAVRSG